MSGKASQPSTAPGGHGKWHSVSPTSNAIANYKRRGGGEPLRGAHSVLPVPAATIDRLGTALDNLGLPTNRSLGIIVGLMATASVSITQVQHVVARPRATRTRQRLPTRWEVVTPTKDGTHVAPDGVGG